MCGIAGFMDASPSSSGDSLQAVAERMATSLRHRGPDDAGVWVDAEAGVALAHRRLSINDLSPQGHQPMPSADGRYVIVFNGEIYNFEDLRAQLEKEGAAPSWRGHSDTEVFLAAISCWGLEGALRESVGMFAFALYDHKARLLHLARDRMGEKPLYYGWAGGTFLFGSELKALREHPKWRGEVDPAAVGLLLRHNYIPAPWSIYRSIRKLPPACRISIAARSLSRIQGTWPEPTPYWDAMETALRGQKDPFAGDEAAALDRLEDLLGQSIEGQMIADVPLGAFLSGGVDSSVVVALMQARSRVPVRTFTVGFHQWDYNEAREAARVAKHLGTDHTELYVSPQEAQEVIPEIPTLYDEPFSDSSQIPTHLIARLARRHVTVSLSGDGGDELFGGYPRYFRGMAMWNRMGWMPLHLRLGLTRVIRSRTPQVWDAMLGWSAPLVFGRKRSPRWGDKLFKLADVLDFGSTEHLYTDLVSHWRPSHGVVPMNQEDPGTAHGGRWPPLADLFHRMMYWDMVTYLPDDILVKVDRAAMAVSLETRLPLLDHRVVEFAWSLPLPMKVRNGTGKRILRQLLYRHVPRELVDRPKMGFGIPIGEWLRGPLRGWAEELLEERSLTERGYLNPEPVKEKWREHLSGQRNWQYLLWDVLMFQAWLRHWHP
jgi:asparagine synthase (glutamine-hydrolysing)